MSCQKHPTDLSSTMGVCASCLSERLFEFMAEQAQARQAQLEQQAHSRAYAAESQKKPDTEPPPLLFPCSVSSYVTSRKSDHNTTPQVGLTYNTVNGVTPSISTSRSSSKFGRFSILSRRFRSRPENFERETNQNSDDRDSCYASSSSPSRRGKPGHGRNVSTGLLSCLSPLVRASPSRQWNQKGGLPPDSGYSTDVRVPVNPHIASATANCANRSR